MYILIGQQSYVPNAITVVSHAMLIQSHLAQVVVQQLNDTMPEVEYSDVFVTLGILTLVLLNAKNVASTCLHVPLVLRLIAVPHVQLDYN